MSMLDAARMDATLVAALGAVLPGVQALEGKVEDSLSEDLPFSVIVALGTGPSQWLLRVACAQGLCASLLARMLGRAASAAEIEEMGAEALAEFGNLLAGRVASLLGEQGLDVEIGIPRAAVTGTALAGQRWRHNGHVFTLALQHVEQESGT